MERHSVLLSTLVCLALATLASGEVRMSTGSDEEQTSPPDESEPPVDMSTDASVAATPPDLPAFGQPAAQDGYSLTVNTVNDPGKPGLLYTPVPGTRLVSFNLTVATDSEDLTVNPFNINLVDTEGCVYQAQIGLVGYEMELVDLQGGKSSTGMLGFAIPETAVPLYLSYEVTESVTLQARVR